MAWQQVINTADGTYYAGDVELRRPWHSEWEEGEDAEEWQDEPEGEEERGGEQFILHIDGEGELIDAEGPDAPEPLPPLRPDFEPTTEAAAPPAPAPLQPAAGFESACVANMQRLMTIVGERMRRPLLVLRLPQQEKLLPGWQPIAAEAVTPGEKTGSELAADVIRRGKQFYTEQIDYIVEKCGDAMQDTRRGGVINFYRVASYFDGGEELGSELGGVGALALDMHLTSDAYRRTCRADCVHCFGSPEQRIDKWTVAQYMAAATTSLCFFDRVDHQAALVEALNEGRVRGGLLPSDEGRPGVCGWSLHPVLDAWYRQYLFGSVHSMETERGVGAVRRAMGSNISVITEERKLNKMAMTMMLDSNSIPLAALDEDEWDLWSAASRAAAERRKAARATAGGDTAGYQAKLQAALEEVKLKAARTGVTAQLRAAGEAAAGERRARQPVSERRALVTSVHYLELQQDLLKVQLPLLPGVSSMKKADVFARLCDDDCGSIESLRSSVPLLLQQAAEIRAGKKTKKSEKALKALAVEADAADARAAGAAAPEAAVEEPDVPCQKCGGTLGEDTLLVCSNCEECCHMGCLRPVLTVVPPGEWCCFKCGG